MKSQTILIRNLPPEEGKKRTKISVKPKVELYSMLGIGVVIGFINRPFALLAISMVILSTFCLVFLPDRVLCEFSNDWMALYNQHNKQECMMIYYEDIVSWQYEWHSSVDSLIICMIDGTTEALDVYSKRRLEKIMNEHVPGKEIKSIRTKR